VVALSGGLALFFALSGYLIAGPFLRSLLEGKRPPAGRRYAIRRAARILPGYWIALIAVLSLATAAQVQHWWQVPLHGFLMQDLVDGESNRLLFVAWTLSVEAMFYIFVPLAALAGWRLSGGRAISLPTLSRWVLGIGVASLAFRFALAQVFTPEELLTAEGPRVARALHRIPNFLYAFAPGALIFLAETPQAAERGGVWAVYRRLRDRPALLAIAAVAILLLHIAATRQGGRWFESSDLLMVTAAGLGVLSMMGDGPRRTAAARILGPIGLISYGVYLWHAVIRTGLERHALDLIPGAHGGLWYWPAHTLLLLALTLPVALASWLFIERPLLRWTSRWTEGAGRPLPPERRGTRSRASASVALATSMPGG
jgi:peptidoglycan/LPS O-acetylase OafA/YrhL